MEITVKLIGRDEPLTGQSPKGEWKKRTIVGETLDRNPRQVAFECWGERCDEVSAMSKGQIVTIDFDLESRQFSGRWYTTAKVYKFKGAETNPYVRQQPQQPVQQPQPAQQPVYTQPRSQQPQPSDAFAPDDKLPF